MIYFSFSEKHKKWLKPINNQKCMRVGPARFFGKIRPEVRGWRFFQKPVGLDLAGPDRIVIFFIGFIISYIWEILS
jgi:hypothetical protein